MEYYFKSLEIREKSLGKNHPATAGSYKNIGNLFLAEKEFNKALEYYQKALAVYELKDQLKAENIYQKMAYIYQMQNNTTAAEKYLSLMSNTTNRDRSNDNDD